VVVISASTRAEIRRLYTIEQWRKHTIARHLGIHPSTVVRALEQEGITPKPRPRGSMIEPYLPWLREMLERYPRLPASTLYRMVRSRGYPGGESHFRHLVAELDLRPRRAAEAFLELKTLPGEQAQVDWAYFGERQVLGGLRKLWAFIMVLSYSRWIFFRFFYDARLPSFLAGHVLAWEFFGGTVRTLLYDNLKSAVLERRGDVVRFHPRLLEMADHYGFEPRPVAPRRGNEKGRVERAIRYLRSSFFPLRHTWSLEALNEAALEWSREIAAQRRWPQDRRRSVEQAYHEERGHLLALPAEPFPSFERVSASLRRSPYVRFDANRYSVPHDRVQRNVTVLADLERVRIFDRNDLIAEHERSWDKQQVIEDPAHIADLWRAKHHARTHRGQDRLTRLVPQTQDLLTALAQRQRHLATAVQRLVFLLDTYGTEEMQHAVAEALEKGSPHPETVRLILERRAHRRGTRPVLPIPLPDDPRIRDLVVQPHRLADYDPEEETP
jgi:transposase